MVPALSPECLCPKIWSAIQDQAGQGEEGSRKEGRGEESSDIQWFLAV